MSTYPHRIRLRQPWLQEPLSDSPRRIRWRRRFGYPGRIDAHERVWLTLLGVTERVEVSLNGEELGEGVGDFEFEVTARLTPRNEMVLEGPAGLTFAEVALEVRATAYLRNLRFQLQDEDLLATGEIVGHADGPLDLYLILDRSPSAYASVLATPEGNAFRLSAPLGAPGAERPQIAKIELVQGAVTWYTSAVPLTEAGAEGSGR